MRFTASILAILISAAPAAAAPSGKEIIEKVLNQPSPTHAIAVLKMTISGENAGIRQLTSYVKRTDGKTKSVVKFQEPADYRGAGILVIEKEGGEMERSIRLNGQKRVRRLPAGSQHGAFLNTDFSYEDLDGRKDSLKEDKHNLLREEVLQGQACYVVETIPSEDGGSAYKRIVQWIRKDNYVPVQIEFYDGSDKPMKRLVVEEVKNVDGFWVSTKSRMSTISKGSSTQLDVTKTDFKSDVPDSNFTDRFLLE
jgi:hypothetical protein